MFDSLEDKMEADEGTAPSVGSRLLRYGGMALGAVVVLGALVMAIALLE